MRFEAKLPSRNLKRLTLIAIAAVTLVLPIFAVFGQDIVSNDVSHLSVSVPLREPAHGSLADVTAFYQTVFGILIAALGLVVALAYLTIRAVSREAAVKTVQDEVNRYFTRDKPFLDSIQTQITSQMADSLAESGLPEQMTQLHTRIAALEARTARLQRQDGLDDDQTSVVNEGEK